jgi:uncharacterized membrane protein YhhN
VAQFWAKCHAKGRRSGELPRIENAPDPAMSPLIFCALCGLFTVGLVAAESRLSDVGRWIFKPAASLMFILAAIAAGALESALGQWVLAGLILSALGDILLIPRKGPFFLFGMAAFGMAHAAYAGGFIAAGVSFGTVFAGAALGAALFAGGLLLWLWPDLGTFRAPVAAYSVIIAAMTALAAGHWEAAPSGDGARLAVAAAAFAVSDLSVARDKFRKTEFVNKLCGLPLYYAAQCLFAISV